MVVVLQTAHTATATAFIRTVIAERFRFSAHYLNLCIAVRRYLSLLWRRRESQSIVSAYVH